MNSFSQAIIATPAYESADSRPVISFEEVSDTLILDEVEIRLDVQLGDDDLGVSLLVESLEQQYQEMIKQDQGDEFLSLQNAKEWVIGNKDRLSGLFRYLKSLSTD